MLYKTTRLGAGAGTAIVTATSTEKLSVGKYVFIQLLSAGPVTVVLKLGTTAIHSPILLSIDVPAVAWQFPEQLGARGEGFFVDLSVDGVSVSVTADVEKIAY